MRLKATAHPQSTGKVLDDLYSSDPEELPYVYTIIKHIANLGGHPQPPQAKRLSHMGDPNLCELRPNINRERLLRIYYFVSPEEDAMILLNAIIKPDGHNLPARYEGNSGHRLKRDIKESIQLALSLKKEYPLSKNKYEPLAI
jgi:hypothetical protein